jgi:hypothetical protein
MLDPDPERAGFEIENLRIRMMMEVFCFLRKDALRVRHFGAEAGMDV